MPSAPQRLTNHRSACIGALWLLSSCSRHEAAPTEKAPPGSTERRLAMPSAFDLVPAPAGGLLVWAGGAPPALHLEALDAAGRVQPAALPTLAVGEGVADVAAASLGAARVVAWSERGPGGRQLRAAWIGTEGPTAPFELGPIGGDASTPSGGVALAAGPQGARLLARGGATECSSTSSEGCQAFRFFNIDASGARTMGMPLAVPNPCASRAAQLVPGGANGGATEPFEYALCSAVGDSSVLTVFSIQPSPAYAMAEEVFAGCTPLGAARFAGDAVFVAACAGERRLARLDRARNALRVESLEPRGVICGPAGANVRLGSGWLRPSEPLGGLELLLGDDLAPPGARAIWTGTALIVARATAEGTLALERHVCRGTSLIELEVGADAG